MVRGLAKADGMAMISCTLPGDGYGVTGLDLKLQIDLEPFQEHVWIKG